MTDGTGTTAVDISGGGNDGTRTSGDWNASSVGTVANFTASSANRFDCGVVDASLGTGITQSAWIRISGNPTLGRILSKDDGASRDWFIQTTTGPTSTEGFVGTGVWADDGTLQTLNSTSTVLEGVWYHIVSAWDNNTLKIYIDGVLDSSTTFVKSGPRNGATTSMVVGGYERGTGAEFAGDIANVRIWSRALSEAEVWDIYQNPWLGSAYSDAAAVVYQYILRSKRFRRL